jgi:LysR family hydrogen peroxide-inducible transcriptional activator
MDTADALSLRQLTYLISVSETRNFTQAAERCFVTQSTLSGGIKELERVLAASLVERDRHHVLMTPVGEQVVMRGRQILAASADLVALARDQSAPMTGTISLGAIPTVAPFMLPPLLRALRKRFPKLRVVLREEQTARLLAEVESGRLDFALIALPYDTGRLRVERLFDEDLWLIAATSDPLAGREAIRTDAVAPDRLLLLEEGHCLREHTLQACRPVDRASGASGIEATSLPTLVQMVEAKLGVALLPEMAIKGGILAGALVEARRLKAPAPKRTIALVARPTAGRQAELAELTTLATEIGPKR